MLLLFRSTMPGLLAGVLLAAAPAQAQFAVTAVAPAPNLRNAPRNSPLVVTANQAFGTGGATALRVFSQQRGSRSGTTTSNGRQL